MPSDEIEQREQEDPDDVDEVPVETADLDRVVVVRGDDAAGRPPEHHRHDADADDHVEGVEAGHDEVQREEDLRVPEVLRLELETGARDVMRGELRVVLERLDAQERAPERDVTTRNTISR